MEKAGFIINQCERGTILIEMVASMGILLLVVTSILPQAILILQERKNTKLLYTANTLLKEEILLNMSGTEPYSTSVSGVMYTITRKSMEAQDVNQLCIQWHDISKQLRTRCLHVKQRQK